MAKRKHGKASVTLPPLPEGWTDADRLERGEVVTGADLVDALHGGADVLEVRAKVWKVKTPPALEALTLPQRMACMDYAATAEAVASSGGTSDPTGGGGGATPGSRPPSLHRLEAARRLRAMDAALDGLSLVIHVATPGTATGTRPAVMAFRDLARAVAIDHRTRPEILRALGVNPDLVGSHHYARRVATATRDVADILAAVCGFGSSEGARPAEAARIRHNPRNGTPPVA